MILIGYIFMLESLHSLQFFVFFKKKSSSTILLLLLLLLLLFWSSILRASLFELVSNDAENRQ